MDNPTSSISIESLTAYSSLDATMIGALLPALSSSSTGDPIPEQRLRDIIESTHHDQIVARRDDGKIVGIATVSLTFGSSSGRSVWLNDFAVDASTQGSGIGSSLWDEVVAWCQEKQATKLYFTSRPSREAAQRFYLHKGAIIRDTNFFKKEIS